MRAHATLQHNVISRVCLRDVCGHRQAAVRFNRIVNKASGRDKKGLAMVFTAWKDDMFRTKIKNLQTYIKHSVGTELCD